jgi:hypothetical protein
MVVGPDVLLGQNLWHQLDWQSRVEAHAEAWRSVISQLILKPLPHSTTSDEKCSQVVADKILWDELNERVKDRCGRRHLQPFGLDSSPAGCNLIHVFLRDIATLKDADGLLADQNLLAVSVKADRRNRPGAEKSEESAARFFEAIIGLHILADAAAGSIGMPRSSTKESAVFDAFANILLTLRGSLSTLSKFYGVVLPKMRTPQAGLTLRNLSHNLTFHDCEVEVMWRSFPWANFDENTLNVLYVPYPFDFDPNRFQSDTDYYESVGYFTYDPGDWQEIGSVVDLIEEVRAKGIQPHMLVFSETAFNEEAYKRLLTALSHRYGADDPRHMPVVVAGIAKQEHDLHYNELRLATYFAGKWYQLAQHKHHRWQLNEAQIRQYGLQGHLSTARPLFERSIIGQRRLTFYAPTPWLVLSPLICEDLSRIEPVSELIRGVGPTLVLALLLDGPQLAERWPGRYASVLADDPGTGVLTVTSYGAAKASRPHDSITSSPGANSKNNQTTGTEEAVVASWKDAESRFQKLSVSDREAMLVTLTANMGEEVTLDHRRETGKGAGFRLVGAQNFSMPHTKGPYGIDTGLDLGNWSDIREVTALTYVASAALSILRPHYSKHPQKAAKFTDTWDRMHKWNTRCQRVRQLIDIMLGRPVIETGKDWEILKVEEKQKLNHEESQPEYFNDLKANRNALLSHIFRDSNGEELAPNRHLFAVLCFAQSTIDVEVRDEEAIWPTASLRFGSTVLRILFDSIAGIDHTRELPLKDNNNADDSMVYRNRLKIAGWANRINKKAQLWDQTTVEEGERDVIGAPKPLIIPGKNDQSRGKGEAIAYLPQFERERQPHPLDKLIGSPKGGVPTRYDFYRMILELIDAILADEQASLWIRCQKGFQGSIGKTEMRRLTLLVLMMVPALIHEQLEFDHIRLKRTNKIGLSSRVIHELLKKSEKILLDAARKTGTRWNPRKPK